MKSSHFITAIAIIGGSLNDWLKLRSFCDQSVQDKSGLAVGIISKIVSSEFGDFPVKFLILFIEKSLQYHLKPVFRFTMAQIKEEGLENVLERVGRKVIINISMKSSKTSTLSK